MEIKWTFPQFIVKPSSDGMSNVVTGVNWICSGSDKGISAISSGSVSLGTPNPAEFVPYDKITYDMAYQWVSGRIIMENVEKQVKDQIAYLSKSQAQVQPPPF